MSLAGWQRAERSDPYYRYCLGLSGVIGIAVTRHPLGLVGWLALGYIACPYVAPAIRYR